MYPHRVKKHVFILPHLGLFILGMAGFAVGIMGSKFGSSIRVQRHGRSLIVVGTLLIIYSAVHYSIHPGGIWVHFLGIPVRRIRWDQISTAEYIQTWSSGFAYSDNKGHAIAITLSSCPAYTPELDEPSKFIVNHPFSFLFIRFTKRHRKDYVETFRHYFPELSFQLGCDTSWLTDE